MSEEKKKLNTGVTLSYVLVVPRIQRVARQHGYNIAVHGSLQRDLDLVAVPWQEQVSSPHELVAAVIDEIEGFISPVEDTEIPREKPHGRLCFPIHLGSGAYVDLSVLTPHGKEQTKEVVELDPAGEPKLEPTLLETQAVGALNSIKAWLDSEGGEPFPAGAREQMEIVLLMASVRRVGFA